METVHRTGQWAGSVEVVGVFTSAITPKWYWINNVYVKPQHQRKGIGSRICKFLIEQARQAERNILLHTERGNPAAEMFWNAQGAMLIKTNMDGHYWQITVPS